MSNPRKIATFSFVEDDYGRLGIRDGHFNVVSIERIKSWIARLEQNPIPSYSITERESELLIRHKDTFWRGAPGYVYLIRRHSGLYKIGRTGQLKSRMSTLRNLIEEPIELLHVIRCQNCRAIEEALHSMFGHRHVRGEWFALTEDDVTHIMNRDEA